MSSTLGMVELPRSETDVKIDGLSDQAVMLLLGNALGSMQVFETFDVEAAEELVETGMLLPHGADESLPQLFTPTWEGGLASERLRCGVYQHHKQMYAEREARDAMLEAVPGFASF